MKFLKWLFNIMPSYNKTHCQSGRESVYYKKYYDYIALAVGRENENVRVGGFRRVVQAFKNFIGIEVSTA